jgi:hypothetical protein
MLGIVKLRRFVIEYAPSYLRMKMMYIKSWNTGYSQILSLAGPPGKGEESESASFLEAFQHLPVTVIDSNFLVVFVVTENTNHALLFSIICFCSLNHFIGNGWDILDRN